MGRGVQTEGSSGRSRPEYRAQLLRDAVPTRAGIVYCRGASEILLEWSRVRYAVAALVGEPDGVRTVVFDLLVAVSPWLCVACRVDADPATEAVPLAVRIADALGPDRSSASLATLAREGRADLWFPDLGEFEEAALALVEGLA